MNTNKKLVSNNSNQKKPETKQPPKSSNKTELKDDNLLKNPPIKAKNNDVLPSETETIAIYNSKDPQNKKLFQPRDLSDDQLKDEQGLDKSELLIANLPNIHMHETYKNKDEKNQKQKEEEKEQAEEDEDEDEEQENYDNHTNHTKEDNAIKQNYLKSKIEEMNVNKDIKTGITKGLDRSLLSIRDGFITSQLPDITENKSQNINTSKHEHDIKDKQYLKNQSMRFHWIKELKINEASLAGNIYQLNENQKLLENESLLNISISSPMNPIDESVRKDKIQNIKKQKEIFKNRLDEIKKKINDITYRESIECGHFSRLVKDNLLKFEVNFEKDKESTLKKIKHLQEESIIRQQKMSNELGEKYALKVNQIELREKEAENKKMLFLEQIRQQEKELLLKRQQMNSEKMLKMKEYINKKHQSKSYAYLDLSKKYIDQENEVIQREKSKRKQMMKHIKSEEFIDFRNKLSLEKVKVEEELIDKSKKLRELWYERSKLIPEYVNPLIVKCQEEKEMNLALEKERELVKETNCLKRKKYAGGISQPKPNPRLMNFRIDKKVNNSAKKRLETNTKDMRMLLKKNPSTPKTEMKIIKLKEINEMDMKEYKMPKPQKLFKKKVDKTKNKNMNIKTVDYLAEKRKENKSLKETDWKKVIEKENNESSIKECMMSIHGKTIQMDAKIKQKNQLLRLNGGVGRHPDICEEVGNLMINSIKAKLSIIDKAVSINKKPSFSIEEEI